MDSFERFIVENEGADTVRLVMSRREWPSPGDAGLAGLDAKSLAVNTIEGRKKLRKKLPEWVACSRLVYPSTLCTEQCSSSDTARYKASIVQRIFNEHGRPVASTLRQAQSTAGSPTEAAGSGTEETGSPTEAAGSGTEETGSPTEAAGSGTEETGSPTEMAGSGTEEAGSPTEVAGSGTEEAGSLTEAAGFGTEETGSPTEAAGSGTEEASSPTEAAGSGTEETGSPTEVTGPGAKETGSPTEAAGSGTEETGSPTEAAGSGTEEAGSPTEVAGSGTEEAGSPTEAAGFGTEEAGSPTEAAGSGTEEAGSPTEAAGSGTEEAGSAACRDGLRISKLSVASTGSATKGTGSATKGTGSATKGTGSAAKGTGSATDCFLVTELAEVTEPKNGKVADLTGGLGVDSWAFSKVSYEVLYNEMNPELAAAARHNFQALGATNIFIRNCEATADSLEEILGDFKPDVIFMDPARRDSVGKKVFLLEDCSPDVLKMLPQMFETSRFILLKISPMADITMVVERLDRTYESFLDENHKGGWNGQWVREVHVVASCGECKELLILLDREWRNGYSLTCREDGGTLTFTSEEIAGAKAVYPDSTFARIIFEPGKSLTKAGVFNAVCERFGLVKLARFTHLYTIGEPLSDSELEQRTAPLKDFGKVFYVKEILPLNKATMKDVGKRYPHSEVSAKNIPMSSDELRVRLKVRSGDDAHIFGARIETPYNEDNYLIVTEPTGR